jgi:uncharacterized protein YndB with AHSA1/START domain
MSNVTDRIEKKMLLRAPRERVWKAVSEAKRFGYWFGMEVDGEFSPGARMTGRIVPTKVDPEIAKMQEEYRGYPFVIVVERIEPMTLFSLRWHPYAVEPDTDYSQEPMTLVQFDLQDAPGGTLLTISESGFDRVPLARRAEAFRSNSEGWAHQSRMIEKYLALGE